MKDGRRKHDYVNLLIYPDCFNLIIGELRHQLQDCKAEWVCNPGNLLGVVKDATTDNFNIKVCIYLFNNYLFILKKVILGNVNRIMSGKYLNLICPETIFIEVLFHFIHIILMPKSLSLLKYLDIL